MPIEWERRHKKRGNVVNDVNTLRDIKQGLPAILKKRMCLYSQRQI